MAMNDMSLSDIAAVTGRNDGFGDGNGCWWLLVLFALLGGFGNNGWNGYGGNELYPWLNQSQQVNDGFMTQMLNTQMNGIQQGITAGFGDLQTALCAGFNQAQMNTLQSVNGLQAQLAECCCENRLATANQTATILAEHCSDRQALSDGVRDIIQAQTLGTQRILDQMCADKIDQKNERIAELERQLTMANLAASQTVQTAQLVADNARQTATLNPVPIPAYIVANPNTGTTTTG